MHRTTRAALTAVALLIATPLAATACGSDEPSTGGPVTTAPDAMTDGSMKDDSMTDGSMKDDSMTDGSMKDDSGDAMTDGSR